ncbi:unnamed protein product, partial [Closterium sp. NIES-54]
VGVIQRTCRLMMASEGLTNPMKQLGARRLLNAILIEHIRVVTPSTPEAAQQHFKRPSPTCRLVADARPAIRLQHVTTSTAGGSHAINQITLAVCITILDPTESCVGGEAEKRGEAETRGEAEETGEAEERVEDENRGEAEERGEDEKRGEEEKSGEEGWRVRRKRGGMQKSGQKKDGGEREKRG